MFLLANKGQLCAWSFFYLFIFFTAGSLWKLYLKCSADRLSIILFADTNPLPSSSLCFMLLSFDNSS